MYGALDNHVNAIIDFTQAISLSNNFDYAYFNRGREYFNDSQYDLAISDANQAVNLGLKDAYAFSGASYIEKKQINLGIDHLRKAIDNNGESVSFAYLYLGIAYEEKGEIANALNSYNEVVRINNDEQYVIAAQEAINRLKENS